MSGRARTQRPEHAQRKHARTGPVLMPPPAARAARRVPGAACPACAHLATASSSCRTTPSYWPMASSAWRCSGCQGGVCVWGGGGWVGGHGQQVSGICGHWICYGLPSAGACERRVARLHSIHRRRAVSAAAADGMPSGQPSAATAMPGRRARKRPRGSTQGMQHCSRRRQLRGAASRPCAANGAQHGPACGASYLEGGAVSALRLQLRLQAGQALTLRLQLDA